MVVFVLAMGAGAILRLTGAIRPKSTSATNRRCRRRQEGWSFVSFRYIPATIEKCSSLTLELGRELRWSACADRCLKVRERVPITHYSRLITCAALVGALAGAPSMRAIAQERESRPDLSGRWQLNQQLSENAQAKVDRMQSSQGHGPGRHGFGGLFGRLFGGGDMQEARDLVLKAPSSFALAQDGDRIVLTGSDGRVRTLTANGRKEKVNGRDVQTTWNKEHLVSETTIGDAKVTETYERSASAPHLIVTTRMDMRGHGVTVRRVYDAQSPR